MLRFSLQTILHSRYVAHIIHGVVPGLQELHLDGRMLLKWILEKWEGRPWNGLSRLWKWQTAGAREHSKEPSGSIQYGEFLERLRNC